MDAAIDASAIEPNRPDWKVSYDFDGDHVPDMVTTAYSGGAHCCYKVSVGLSKSRTVVELPFELDGGYVTGLDLSRPSFEIEVGDNGIATFHMEIARYGLDYEPIPLEWTKTYGIHSHSIEVSLRDGHIHVENVIWGCEEAIEALSKFSFSRWQGLPPCKLSDLTMERSEGRGRELGTDKRLCFTKVARDLAVGDGSEIVYSLDLIDVVRADFDTSNASFETTEKAKDAIEVYGLPEAKLPYSIWGFTHATGQWVWPSRGIVIYVDPKNTTIEHVGVFAPTDLATYRRTLAWP
ncbi:MAG: hypothetical protein QM831_40010 [Kofleriaceae bacterium]